MRPSQSLLSRTTVPILGFMILALTVSLSSGGTVNAASPPLRPATGGTCPPSMTSGIVCWYTETVDYNSNDFNYITGITDGNHIVGAYSNSNSAVSVYNSFYVAPNPSSTTYPSPFTSNDDPSMTSTFLEGISNEGALAGSRKVGYGLPCPSCTAVGVLRTGADTTATWKTIQNPNNGTCTGTFRITKIMAMNQTEQGVGWYNKKNSLGQCEPQAFEFYPKDGSNFEYHDLNPLPPTSTTGQPVLYSTANGINTLGDVVGTVAYGSWSNLHTAGWIYSELKYFTFQYASHDTYANGVNFSDGVAGDYTTGTGSNIATHGFVVVNPNANTQSTDFVTLDLSTANPPLTVIRAINTNWYITGWYQQGGTYHGFVGQCEKVGTRKSTCPPSANSARKRPRR